MTDPIVELGLRAVRAAATACVEVAGSTDFGKLDKSDKSPVTVADFASQAAVARVLEDGDPTTALVAEENADALRDPSNSSLLGRVASVLEESPDRALALIDRGAIPAATPERFWVLDPIDGTKGFLRKNQYAVALALVERGQISFGALACPRLGPSGAEQSEGAGSVLATRRDGPVFQESLAAGARTSIAVSGLTALGEQRVCESVESGHSRHDTSTDLREQLGIQAEPVRVDSQAKYALVARGDAEIYWRLPTRPGYEERIWDHAAGVLLVQRAGGRVTDIDGKPLDFSCGHTLARNRGVLATNGAAHDAVLEALRPHFQ